MCRDLSFTHLFLTPCHRLTASLAAHCRRCPHHLLMAPGKATCCTDQVRLPMYALRAVLCWHAAARAASAACVNVSPQHCSLCGHHRSAPGEKMCAGTIHPCHACCALVTTVPSSRDSLQVCHRLPRSTAACVPTISSMSFTAVGTPADMTSQPSCHRHGDANTSYM